MARSPDDMTATQRNDEIAGILSEGALRLRSKIIRKTSRLRDIPLDSSARQSVHAPTPNDGDSA